MYEREKEEKSKGRKGVSDGDTTEIIPRLLITGLFS
jgi:hypothetical protein